LEKDWGETMKDFSELKRVGAIWTLRALLHPRALRLIQKDTSWAADEILDFIGLQNFDPEETKSKELKRQFVLKLKELEAITVKEKDSFINNLNLLGGMLGLSEMEKSILTFSLLMQEETGLKETLNFWGDVNFRELIQAISWVLKLPLPEVSQAMDKGGLLRSSGLIKVDQRGSPNIHNRLEPLSGLGNALHGPHLKEVEGLLSVYGNTKGDQLARKWQ